MLSLTEFLLARIAEDEAVARKATADTLGAPLRADEATDRPGVVELAIDPARVLADCEAKRRIVELHVVGDPEEWGPEQWACRLCQWDEDCDSPKHDHQYGAGRFPCDTLRALALPYADHPDYREEWKP